MRWLTLVFAALLSVSGAVQAADNGGRYFIVGAGSRTCQEYTQATPAQRLSAETWLAGYITAVNRLTPDTYHVGGETSVDKVNAMIAQYCASNGDVALGIAIHRVLERLYPQRIRQSPNH
jgi:hypothetical protein